MILSRFKPMPSKAVAWLIPAVVAVVFGGLTFQRTKVWKDSATLWTDVINRYPEAPVPRTNRANNAIKLSIDTAYKDRKNELLQQALEDCTIAIKYKPNHAKGFENRQNIYLMQNKDTLALSDANSLIRLEPENRLGYYTRGVVLVRLNQPDSALVSFNKCLTINPNTDYALNNRGSLLFNQYGKYDDAIADFTRAISINPSGNYYLNRSKCYYKKGDFEKAKADARTALQKGEMIDPSYRQAISL
jgi:protein O-mannosyl-transferase